MKLVFKRYLYLAVIIIAFKSGFASIRPAYQVLYSDSLKIRKHGIIVNSGFSQLFFKRNDILYVKGIHGNIDMRFILYKHFILNFGYAYYGNNFQKLNSVNYYGHINYLHFLCVGTGFNYNYKKYQTSAIISYLYGNGVLMIYNDKHTSAYDFKRGNKGYSMQFDVSRQISNKINLGIYYNNLFKLNYSNYIFNYVVDINDKLNKFHSIGIKLNYKLK